MESNGKFRTHKGRRKQESRHQDQGGSRRWIKWRRSQRRSQGKTCSWYRIGKKSKEGKWGVKESSIRWWRWPWHDKEWSWPIQAKVQERHEELTKPKDELHQNKKKHHEEVISMTNKLDKENEREETLSIHLEQRHEDLNKFERRIGQYNEEISSLKSQLKEEKK